MKDMLDFQNDQDTAVLQNAFIESLPERLEYIGSSWESLLSAEDKKSKMMNFVGAVHYLAGGAGVHGFISMSQRSYQIIGHIQSCLRKNVTLTRDTQFVVDQLVSSLFSLKEYYDENEYEEPIEDKRPAAIGNTCLTEGPSSNEIFILEHSSDEELALKVFLENADMRVCSFKSLHKLQRAISNSSPHAVIVDLQQSNKDATADEFIKSIQNKSVPFPVVALSDTSDIDSRLQAARMGATHFFTKPVDGYRLVDTLHKASSESGLPSRVLLVDDDPETAKYVSIHLRREGLKVHVLNEPLDFLDAMAQFRPDLILTDLYMPGCNGLELATIVRQHEVYYDVPIVFLTSETDEDSRLAALQLGSDDFFTKSIDVNVVAKAVKSRLERMSSYALIKKAMIWSPN